MRREQLFEPGGYMGLPFEIARRRELTWNAKGVWMFLAHSLGPSNQEAWPSLTAIALATGMGRRTVQTCVEALQAAALVEALPPRPGETMTLRDGRVVPATTRYRVRQPEATLFDAAAEPADDEPPAPPAGAAVEPPHDGEGCGRIGASAESALAQDLPLPSADSAHEVLKGSTERKTTTPPTPPDGQGGLPAMQTDSTADNGATGTADNGTAGPDARGDERSLGDVLVDLERRWRAAFGGVAMAVEFFRAARRALEKYPQSPEAHAARTVTAEQLRSAKAWDGRAGTGQKRRRYWTWPKVVAWLAWTAEGEAAQAAEIERRRRNLERRRAEEAERDPARAEAAARLTAFRALPLDRRCHYLAHARASPGGSIVGEMFVEVRAAQLWEQDAVAEATA